MKKRTKNIWNRFSNHELVRGSTYIFIGGMAANVLNFLFNIFMSRNLSIEEYGVLTSLITLIILCAVPAGSIIPTIINFAGDYFARKQYDLVSAFFFRIIKYLSLISLALIFLFIVFSGAIGNFFKINNPLLIIVAGFLIAITYLGVVGGGLLQAKLEFKFISLANFIATFIKILAGVILVLAGFSVVGAILAVFLSFILHFTINFIPLKFILIRGKKHLPTISFRSLFYYGVPASLATLGLTSLISTDILLVKHFYDPSFAGIYAGLSLIGKTIFFFTAPIGTVMFPLVVQKQARGEDYFGIFKMAIILVLAPSLIISAMYFLYPEMVIRFFLKKDEYLSASSLVGLFGIFISAYSLISLFVYYFLSVKKTKIYISIILAAISQAILIYLFHKSFLEIIIISLSVAGLLLGILIFYFIKVSNGMKKNKKNIVLVADPIS